VTLGNKQEQSTAPSASLGVTHAATLVAILANRLRRGGSRYYRRRYGIGMGEWRVFLLLGAPEGICAQDICKAADLDKAAVSRSLRILDKLGWIKLGGDSNSRRRMVTLTKRGERLHEEILGVAREREARLMIDLSKDEVATLDRLLRRLIDRVDYMNKEPPPRRQVRHPSRLTLRGQAS
jgi:DNA-binding MarR family transcriptional regulator